MSTFGKFGTGGAVPAPPVSTRSEPESPCDVKTASTGTTQGQPDTKPAVNP